MNTIFIRKTSLVLVIMLACLLALTCLMIFSTSNSDIANADDTYDLWIADVQVTSSNLSGDKWSYNPSTNTLTLANGYSFFNQTAGEVHYAPIYYGGSDDFIIVFEGNAYFQPYMNGSTNIVAGIFSASNLTINGIGSVVTINVNNYSSTYSYGIQCQGKLTINGGSITITTGYASSQSIGIYCQNSGGYEQNAGSVTINPGDSTTPNAYGIYNDGSAVVQGGYLTINAKSDESTSYAYYGSNSNSSLTVKENVDKFEAKSNGAVTGGLGGGIKNTFTGYWYPNTSGEDGKTAIEKSSTPQVFTSAKRMVFQTPYMNIDDDQDDCYYDGQTHTPSITVNEPSTGYTIKWGTEYGVYNLDSAPSYTDAGDYYIYYQVIAEGYMTEESSFTFSIQKGEWNVLENPTQKDNLKYTGEEMEVANPGRVGDDNAKIYYTLMDSNYDYIAYYSEEMPTAKEVGTYHFYFEVEEDDNHELYEINFEITINKGDIELDVAPTAIAGLMYTGQAQELINAGSVYDRTIYYKIGVSGEYSENIPTATEIGTYTIYYKVNGDSNYNDLEGHLDAEILKPYVFDSFVWAADNLSAQAKLVNPDDESDTLLVPATVNSQVISQPTCVNKGVTRYTATYSTEEESIDVRNIDELGHSLVHHDAVPATTEATGNIEYWTCTRCEEYFSDSQGLHQITQQDTITARLEKEIKDNTSGVSIKINGEDIDRGFAENISLKVEVKTNISVKEGTTDYAAIQNLLRSDEKINGVYDVKLIMTVDGVDTEIQPSDIKEGTTITVKMNLPNGVDPSDFRLLHIHAINDMEFIGSYTADGNTISFTINRLSEFAFIVKNTDTVGASLPGWAIALIVIGGLLVLCCVFFLLLFFVFNKWIKIEDKAVRAIKVGKKDDQIKLMRMNFSIEYRVKEEVFDTKKDAEDAEEIEQEEEAEEK